MICSHLSPADSNNNFNRNLIASGCDLHTHSPSCSPLRSCVYPYWLLLTLTPLCNSESSCSDLSGPACCAVEAWCPLTHVCARPSQLPHQATLSLLRLHWHSRLLPDMYLYGKRSVISFQMLPTANTEGC